MATTRTLVFVIFILFHVINFHITDVAAAVCWTATNDVHGFHGTHHSVATLDECKTICISNNLCKAIDWEWSSVYGETCWILTSITTGPTQTNGTITHYELNRTCDTSVAITTRLPVPTPVPTTSKPSTTVETSSTAGVPRTGGSTTSRTTTTAGNESVTGRFGAVRTDTEDVLAIRPAYVVIAGLGAGNLLLVVVAIVVICSYPLNRTDSHKNGVSGGGGGGGGGGVENYQMEQAHPNYDEHGYIEPDVDHDQPPPPQWGTGYSDENENEANDKRYTSSSYDDQPPAVEENPYFNKDEIEASAAF